MFLSNIVHSKFALDLFLLSEPRKIIPSSVDKGAHIGTIGMSAYCQKRGRSFLTLEKKQSWWPTRQKQLLRITFNGYYVIP
jgi:hypothetical protein